MEEKSIQQVNEALGQPVIEEKEFVLKFTVYGTKEKLSELQRNLVRSLLIEEVKKPSLSSTIEIAWCAHNCSQARHPVHKSVISSINLLPFWEIPNLFFFALLNSYLHP